MDTDITWTDGLHCVEKTDQTQALTSCHTDKKKKKEKINK